MHFFIRYLSVLALATILISSSLAIELDRRQRTSVEGNFTTTSMSSDSTMMTAETGSSTASRIIVTSATSVQSATTTPHGATAAGTSSSSASATSSGGQNHAIGLSDSQYAVGIGAIAGFMAFNML